MIVDCFNETLELSAAAPRRYPQNILVAGQCSLYYYRYLNEMADYSRFSSTGSRFTPFGVSANPMMGNYNLLNQVDSAFIYNRIHSLKT